MFACVVWPVSISWNNILCTKALMTKVCKLATRQVANQLSVTIALLGIEVMN